MNSVEVIGGKKDRKELAYRVVAWYLDTIMPRMKTLDITVNLTNCYGKGAYGYCMMGENNREFEIEIDKNLRLYDFVSTLCHELTHLKQYARGEMKQLSGGQTRWKKKIYPQGTAYDDSPWEKEAWKIEKQLAMQCFEEVL